MPDLKAPFWALIQFLFQPTTSTSFMRLQITFLEYLLALRGLLLQSTCQKKFLTSFDSDSKLKMLVQWILLFAAIVFYFSSPFHLSAENEAINQQQTEQYFSHPKIAKHTFSCNNTVEFITTKQVLHFKPLLFYLISLHKLHTFYTSSQKIILSGKLFTVSNQKSSA